MKRPALIKALLKPHTQLYNIIIKISHLPLDILLDVVLSLQN